MTLTTTPSEQQDAPASAPTAPPRSFGWAQLTQALPGALRKLNPASLVRNPVMLLVWVGAAFTTVLAIAGPAGKAVLPNTPNLAGQVASYLEIALKAYRDGKRSDPMMSPMAKPLTDDDIANLAAHGGADVPPPSHCAWRRAPRM